MERPAGSLLYGFQRLARQFADISPTGLDLLDLMQLLGSQLIDVLWRGVGFFRLRAQAALDQAQRAELAAAPAAEGTAVSDADAKKALIAAALARCA